jgi:hypothetical protein
MIKPTIRIGAREIKVRMNNARVGAGFKTIRSRHMTVTIQNARARLIVVLRGQTWVVVDLRTEQKRASPGHWETRVLPDSTPTCKRIDIYIHLHSVALRRWSQVAAATVAGVHWSSDHCRLKALRIIIEVFRFE